MSGRRALGLAIAMMNVLLSYSDWPMAVAAERARLPMPVPKAHQYKTEVDPDFQLYNCRFFGLGLDVLLPWLLERRLPQIS